VARCASRSAAGSGASRASWSSTSTGITNAAAPHWPRAKIEENDAYRIVVEGSPNIVQETAFRGVGGDSNAGGCLATGMRAVNAIPAVCAAKPGLLSPLDLPLIPGFHNMHLGRS
jgi:4-hydroxy-tetrahydrodipicolinate reductase